jgi:uncharacterized membrane protein YphA (DoxX/SURF4 family)
MFPTGSVGIALGVLRSVVAVTLFVNAATCWPSGLSLVVSGTAALVGLLLLLGLFTPYGAAASCIMELALLVTGRSANGFELVTSALTAATTVILGPGAYSVDARLFGRRLIKIPPGQNSANGR